ncbi:MAG: site-2 protease family protein [Anaerolineales bacterium]|nr:site-2 protease family protein [Anaerolineales bacterium]
MSWSIKLGRFAGIDVFLHLTFLLLVAFVGYSGYLSTRSVAGAIEGVVFILALFGSVVLHEYGHALTARRFGIPTRDITLYPIGGVARLERMPERPWQELIVAVAGPAVNVAIAIVLFVGLLATGNLSWPSLQVMDSGPLLERLMYTNLSLALFNLIPAFPMDGGRVLRAGLAMYLNYAMATRIAAGLGKAVAVIFGFVGLFANPMLVLVALFVWFAADQESQAVQMRSALYGIPVGRAMVTDFRTVSQYDPLLRVSDLLIVGAQEDFPVVDDGRMVGLVTREDLITGLARRGLGGRVGEVMRRRFLAANPFDQLEAVVPRMQSVAVESVPVLEHGQLVGMLTAHNVREYLMIQEALRRRR